MTKCYLKAKIRDLESEIMNGRQAAKLAARKIEELENDNRRCKADITGYNVVIQALIRGESPCPWCEEYSECQLTEKDAKGCEQWWLAFTHPDVKEDADDDSEGVPFIGSTGRA